MDVETQRGDRAGGRAFAEREIAPSVTARDRESRWDETALQRLAEAGLLGAPLPRDAGGAGLDAGGFSSLLRGFVEGSGDAGLALAWAAHVGAAQRIVAEGNAEQRRRLLPTLARGEAIAATARREAGRAGDPLGIATRAVTRGACWVLDGAKSWVVNGGVAAVFVVDAITDPARGKEGISTFLVRRDAPGLRVGPRHETSGLRTAVITDVLFEGVEIPREDRLGEEGSGFGRAARIARSFERAQRDAIAVGLARAVFDQTVTRSRESIHLGRPLGSSQAVRAALADMRIQVELAERIHARAAWLLSGADPAGAFAEREIALASLFVARSAPWVVEEAARSQGAAGATLGHLAERSLRDTAVLGYLADRRETLRSAIAGSLLGIHDT